MTREVNFCPCVDHCELTIESAKNYYIIKFQADGRESMFVNCQHVEHWPAHSPLYGILVRAAETLKPDILAYMNETDETKRRVRYWKIRDALRGASSKSYA